MKAKKAAEKKELKAEESKKAKALKAEEAKKAKDLMEAKKKQKMAETAERILMSKQETESRNAWAAVAEDAERFLMSEQDAESKDVEQANRAIEAERRHREDDVRMGEDAFEQAKSHCRDMLAYKRYLAIAVFNRMAGRYNKARKNAKRLKIVNKLRCNAELNRAFRIQLKRTHEEAIQSDDGYTSDATL